MTYETLNTQAARTSNHPDMANPIKGLTCTCCGAHYKGRQYWNQDEGWSLGQCCVDFCRERVADFEGTYGAPGVHYNIDFNLDTSANYCRPVLGDEEGWSIEMSVAAQSCGWDIFEVVTASEKSLQVLKLDKANSINRIPVHATDSLAWTWMLYGTSLHEQQARAFMQDHNPAEWQRMLAWKVEHEKYLEALAQGLSEIALGNIYSEKCLKAALLHLNSLKMHSRIKDSIYAIECALAGEKYSHHDMQDAAVGLKLLAKGKKYEGFDHWAESPVFENFIKVAADSIEQLRKIDVYRVIESVVNGNVHCMTRKALGCWISDKRPDLRRMVEMVVEDIAD